MTTNKVKSKLNKADELLEILNNENVKMFINQKKEFLVQLEDSKILKLESKEFKTFLISLFYRRFKSTIGKEAINNVIEVMKSWVYIDDKVKEINTFKRFGIFGNKLYYYLNNSNEEVVAISGDHYEIISASKCPVCFLPNKLMLAQDTPKSNDLGYTFTDYMKKYFGKLLKESELILHNTLLLYRFLLPLYKVQPIGSYVGKQGSGKSTCAKLDLLLLNPVTNLLSSMPDTFNEWLVLLENTDTLCIDNVSKFNKRVEDLLCNVVTGGTGIKRKLFSDTDIVDFNINSAVYTTSLSNITNAQDLNERIIAFHVQSLQNNERREDNLIFKEFYKDRPYILGEIFKAISIALSNEEMHKPMNYHIRMTSFEKMSITLGKAIGYTEDEVVEALIKNKHDIDKNILESDNFLSMIYNFTKDCGPFNDTPTSILIALNRYAKAQGISIPSLGIGSANAFTRKLNKVKNSLLANNIHYSFRQSNGKRLLSLEYINTEEESK